MEVSYQEREIVQEQGHVAWFYLQLAGEWAPVAEQAGFWRMAASYARAEKEAVARGWVVDWAEDWSCGSHQEFYGPGSAYENGEPDTCEDAVLLDADGNVIGAVGCVDDATPEYRRMVASELAQEALDI